MAKSQSTMSPTLYLVITVLTLMTVSCVLMVLDRRNGEMRIVFALLCPVFFAMLGGFLNLLATCIGRGALDCWFY